MKRNNMLAKREKRSTLPRLNTPVALLSAALLFVSAQPLHVAAQTAVVSNTTVTDAIGTQEVWTFEENLGVLNVTGRVNQVDGKGAYQAWDSNNNLISRTDPEGQVTTYTYNATNQRTSMTEASGTPEARITTYEYVSPDIDIVTRTNRPSIFAGNTKSVITTYDSELNATRTEITGFAPDGSPVSRTMDFTYDDLGKITQIDGYRTDVADITTFTYYNCLTGVECGQLQSVSNALGHTTTYDSYDGGARLLQSTDQNGIVTTFTYHPRGWLLNRTQTAPNGEQRVTSYQYDNVGQMTQSTLPDGTVLTYTYDAAHNLRSISDNLNNRVEYTYDPKGNRNVEQTFDPDNTLVRDIQTSYDIRNFVSGINTAGSVTQMVNDAVGNLTTQTDPNQNPSTQSQYDGLYRLSNTIDALTNSTGYDYNVADQLIQVTAPNGAVTSYQYDDLGNLLQETSPDRGTTTYTHDDAGNVTSMTDARGIISNYTYDALNRLTNVTYPTSAENVTYHYDTAGATTSAEANACHQSNEAFAAGRLCQVIDESGQMNYQYDVWGNVQKHTRQELGRTFITQYQYDNQDRVTQMTYPSGRLVDYQRDAIGRLIGATTTDIDGTTTPLITGRTYRADGLWTEQVYGSGLLQNKSYDQQGRLTEHQVSNTGNVQEYSRQYTYDANGNITRENSIDLLYDTDYQYDVLDRLNQELDSIASLTRGFQYDGNGNRLTESETQNGASQITPLVYTANSNRIETIDGQTITLDASGRTLQDGAGRSYAYNNAGRIQSISMSGQVVGEYIYNSQQLRTRKVVNGNTIFYHYDLAGNLLAESGEQDSTTQEYLYADGERIATDAVAAETPAPVNLALGKTARQISTSYGAVANRAVDGDTNGQWANGSVTHTTGLAEPWWEVDLGAQENIDHVTVYNRTDCCSSRLSDFYVFVSDTPFADASLSDLIANTNIERVFHSGPLATDKASFAMDVQGRYVRVQLTSSNNLHLAEVEVMGLSDNSSSNAEPPTSANVQGQYVRVQLTGSGNLHIAEVDVQGREANAQTPSNLALGKTATQISTSYGAVASRAVDGNTSGQWANGSVTHTTGAVQPWWQVNLGESAAIDSITVYNRTDCCSTRLSDFYVLVSDTPFANASLNDLIADPSVHKFFHQGIITGDSLTFQTASEAEEPTPDQTIQKSIQYYVNDHLNTPHQLLNENNQLTWAAEYEAFGEATITTELVTNNHRFPGQYYDQESELHYNWNRYYDPIIGRYITSDPIGLGGGLNTYAYVGGNPLSYYDENGLTRGSRNNRYTSITQTSRNQQYNTLLRQIRQIDPVYQPPAGLRPAGSRGPGQGQISLMRAALRNAQNAGFCGAGASSGRFGSNSPDFVVGSGGIVFVVPTGAVGPRPVINNSGNITGSAFVNGSGGANGQVSTMRIMNANRLNPNGYIRYTNSSGQGVNPVTGRTGSNSSTHIPIK